MEIFWTVLAYVSVAMVWIRFIPFIYSRKEIRTHALKELPSVSIIIPVRNESRVIEKLLRSLLALNYPALGIVVVDDGSTDNTVEIAKRFPVKILPAGERPQGWTGKSWACAAGAGEAEGELLLFTDADTVHKPDSLKRAVSWFREVDAHMISAPVYHRNDRWWEKLLGPFFCTMYCGASPFDKTSSAHPYALGQYLLIDKEFYHRIGGHASVRDALADDASLARRLMTHGGKYRMVPELHLCDIQMYHSFREFLSGWHRILRLGMRELKIAVILNTLFPFFALNLASLPFQRAFEWMPLILLLFCFAVAQRKIGNFNILGVAMFPVGIGLFLLMGLWASITEGLNLPVKWRGRSYVISRN